MPLAAARRYSKQLEITVNRYYWEDSQVLAMALMWPGFLADDRVRMLFLIFRSNVRLLLKPQTGTDFDFPSLLSLRAGLQCIVITSLGSCKNDLSKWGLVKAHRRSR